MVKIVVAQELDLLPDQIARLDNLGEVKIYNDAAETPEAWLDRCRGFDIVCTHSFGLRQKIYELENVFISLPLVGIGWMDAEKLKAKNIKVANSPGCNKAAVSEWIIGMMINLLRDLPKQINAAKPAKYDLPKRTLGLAGKKVCILGAGNIGNRVGKICEAFDMRVNFFKQGDDIMESAGGADVVVNCLSQNPTTVGLLNDKFFSSFKNGAYFISVTSPKIYDVDALLVCLGKNIAAAAIDAGDAKIGDAGDDFYQKLLTSNRILATPHIAFNTDVTARVANDMMIDNIEAYLKGEPMNLLW
jgi:phosphoglycerate dehydrogenase-like enzyme